MSVLSQISRALVAEDNFVLAVELQNELSDLGCPESVVASRVESAILALKVGVQFAILDVELAGEPCTELAERLVASRVPSSQSSLRTQTPCRRSDGSPHNQIPSTSSKCPRGRKVCLGTPYHLVDRLRPLCVGPR